MYDWARPFLITTHAPAQVVMPLLHRVGQHAVSSIKLPEAALCLLALRIADAVPGGELVRVPAEGRLAEGLPDLSSVCATLQLEHGIRVHGFFFFRRRRRRLPLGATRATSWLSRALLEARGGGGAIRLELLVGTRRGVRS